jgi:hypothetical protein
MPSHAATSKRPPILLAAQPAAAQPASTLADPDALLADTIARHGDDPDFVTALVTSTGNNPFGTCTAVSPTVP